MEAISLTMEHASLIMEDPLHLKIALPDKSRSTVNAKQLVTSVRLGV
jgi:hypothetical protein